MFFRYFLIFSVCAAFCFGNLNSRGEEAVQGTPWAILVGVNDYASFTDLRYAASDMSALKDRLISAGFPEDHVFLVQTEAADSKYLPFKANIEKQLKMVLGFAGPNDLVVVAFSGHGLYLDGARYLCPTEADVDRSETLISVDDVYKQLQGSQASLKVFIVDACRNDPRPSGRKSASPKQDLAALGKAFEQPPPGIVLLSSCAAGEISMESEKFGHGVFMNFLLEGLDGKADENTDEIVSLSEAADYAGRMTKVFVARTYNDSQRPFISGDLSVEALKYAIVKRLIKKTELEEIDSTLPMVPIPQDAQTPEQIFEFLDGLGEMEPAGKSEEELIAHQKKIFRTVVAAIDKAMAMELKDTQAQEAHFYKLQALQYLLKLGEPGANKQLSRTIAVAVSDHRRPVQEIGMKFHVEQGLALWRNLNPAQREGLIDAVINFVSLDEVDHGNFQMITTVVKFLESVPDGTAYAEKLLVATIPLFRSHTLMTAEVSELEELKSKISNKTEK